MQNASKGFVTVLMIVIVAVFAACEDDPTGPPTGNPPPSDQAVLSGDITGLRTLSADTTYLLQGTVVVRDGAELHIPAGTTILGDVDVSPTALIVRRGARIFAEGTAVAPIIFTSSAPEGERRRGDWGGVVINGASICNFPANECVGEGNVGPYGGNELNDDSGVMTYVRIGYCGYEVSLGNELNCLTLNGVGSGTTLHHIQAHHGSDDGIEFFGGTVDLKYALSTANADDSFDYSTGWQGRGQFWIAQQDPNNAGNGFEVDGNEQDYNATPLTSPTIYNVTLIGRGDRGSAGASTNGLLLRRGTAGEIQNAIVTGFGESGLDIDNTESYDRVQSGTLIVDHSIFFGNTPNFSSDDDEIPEGPLATETWQANRTVDPGLAAPYNLQSPDFRPTEGAAALEGVAAPPNDGFFTPVDFLGGVAPGDTPWYAGWTVSAQP